MNIRCHMVGNSVHDDTDTSISAGRDHGREFSFGTTSTRQGVGHGLIVDPGHFVSTLGCSDKKK
jgi:hypothetical protein